MTLFSRILTVACSVCIASTASAEWRVTPFLEFGELPEGSTTAVSSEVLAGPTVADAGDNATPNSDYSALSGAFAILFEQNPKQRNVLRFSARRTDVLYTSILQEREVTNVGFGYDHYLNSGPIITNVGLSLGVAQIDNTSDLADPPRSNWTGNFVETHLTLSGTALAQENRHAGYFVAGQMLQFEEDAHSIGISVFPKETRESRTLSAGVTFSEDLSDRGQPYTLWGLAGLVHEFEDRPPQRPTLISSGSGMQGTFTLFNTREDGIPDVFPTKNTLVLGLGLRSTTPNGTTVNAGLYHEANDNYDSTYLRIGIVVPR